MPLIPSTCAANIYNAYQDILEDPPVGDYPALFATYYNNYVLSGIITGAINTGGVYSILETAVQSAPTTAEALGLAFANYWATVAIIPLAPNIASVNNAALLSASFASAIQDSITDEETNPPFEALISNIESVVNTIVWTITTSSGGTVTTGIA